MPVRSLVRRLGRLIPVGWRLRVQGWFLRLKEPGMRRLYERTAIAPAYLGRDELAALAREFPVEPSSYLYDPDALENRGEERAKLLLSFVEGHGTFLEIGAADGMVLRAIAGRGHTAIGVDIEAGNLDPRARAAGVQFIQTDATRLCFPDESIDVVYSFATFEHLPDPDATFTEIARVLKRGGHAYIDFAGLGWTPHGAHMYKTFGIPYITALFERKTIDDFVAEQRLDHYFPYVNNWGIEQFRSVWKRHVDALESISYHEDRNRFHYAFMQRFMPHLRRSPSFDSLLVDHVQGIFRKR